MENLAAWTADHAQDELPVEEALIRLYELCARYDVESATATYSSAAAKHARATGHRLRHGCCSHDELSSHYEATA